ncbi:hypothetical protein RND81_12G091600 [Saponaria officinalis]|uniref:SWIM-type domain-containing protein n=1 Tax=Saponaria officinalis TaxID=3572 RepID=A0AAW1H8D0_SAPOF
MDEGVDMTSNAIPSTPLARPPTVEKHTPPILLSYSPKGSQQWIRKVEEEFTPRVGMEFDTLEDGIQFYRIYTIACGFDIIKSSQRRFRDQSVRTKHIVCNREGFGESNKMKKLVNTESDETPNKKERVTTIRRFGCAVFQKFIEEIGRKEPQLIITDQDPAIRNAVPTVFKTERHRYCMWHIKVADKIDIITRKETDFLSRLNGVVWNKDLEPTEFGDKRKENSSFNKFENHYGTLVEFLLRYESAMDQQRNTHKCLKMESNNSVPKTTTPLSMESHALTVYTHEIFYEIQEEIKSSMCACGIVGYSRSASFKMTAMEDSQRNKTFAVQYNSLTSDVLCTCKLFERRGLICRHIFWVFLNKLLKTIPEKYILTQWSKNALRGPIYDLNGNIIENYDTTDESQLEISKVWSEFYNVIFVVSRKEADVLRDLQRREMEMLIGCSTPDEVRILPTRHLKNNESRKRIVTSKNKAIEKAKKPKRRCGNCKRMAYHDSRNYQEPFAKHPPDEDESSDSERVD